jgi:hypothetical protein
MSGKSDKFTRMHEAAVAAVLRTTTLESVAKSIGVNERTLRRWWLLPEFQAKYMAAKRELINGTIHTLLHATGTATHALVNILQDTSLPPTARVSAARTVLQLVMHVLHNDDIEARLIALENQGCMETIDHGPVH